MVVMSLQSSLMARESRHLLVSGLPETINDEKINTFFSQYGRVQKSERCNDGIVVSFMDVRSAQKAQTGEHRLEPGLSFRLSFHEPSTTIKNGMMTSSLTNCSTTGESPKLSEARRRTPSPRVKDSRSSQLRASSSAASSKRAQRQESHRREGRSPEGSSTAGSIISSQCVSGIQGVYVDLDRLSSRSEVTVRDGLRDALKKFGKLAHVLVEGEGEGRRALVIFNSVLELDKLWSEKHVTVLSQRCRLRQADAMDVQLAYSTQLALTSAVAAGTRDTDLPAKYASPNGSSSSSRGSGEVDVYSPKASRTLYVGGLESRQSEESLRRRFDRFGDILDVDVKNFESPSPFAFIQFADIDSAVRAINMYAKQATPGQNKKGKPYFGRSISTNKLWVGSIPATAAEGYVDQKLKGMMDGAQDVFYDQQIGQAIVTFSSLEHAQAGWSKIRNGVCQLKCDGQESRLSVDFCSDRLLNFFLDRKHNRPSTLNCGGGGTTEPPSSSSILNPPPDPPSDMPTYGSYRYDHHRDSRRSPSSLSRKRDRSRSRQESRDRSRDRSRHRDRKSSRYNDFDRTVSRRKDRKERKASSSPTSSRSSSGESSRRSGSSSSRDSSPLSYSQRRGDREKRRTDDRRDKEKSSRGRQIGKGRSPFGSGKWSDRPIHVEETVLPTAVAQRLAVDVPPQERAQSGDSGFCEESRAPLDPPPAPPPMDRIPRLEQSPPPNDPPAAPPRSQSHILSPPTQPPHSCSRDLVDHPLSTPSSRLTECRQPSQGSEHGSAQAVNSGLRHQSSSAGSSSGLRDGKRTSQEGVAQKPPLDLHRDPVHRLHHHKGPIVYYEGSTKQHGASNFSLKDATFTAPGTWPWKEFLRHPVNLPLEAKSSLVKDPRKFVDCSRQLVYRLSLPPFTHHLETAGEKPKPLDLEPRKRSSGSSTSFDAARRTSGGGSLQSALDEVRAARPPAHVPVSRSSSSAGSEPQLSPTEPHVAPPPSSLDFLSDPDGLKLTNGLNNTMLARMDTIGSRVMEVGSSFKSLRDAAGVLSSEENAPAPQRTNVPFEERLQMLRKKRVDLSLPSLNLDKIPQQSSFESGSSSADLSTCGFSRNATTRPAALHIQIPTQQSSSSYSASLGTPGSARTDVSPLSSRKSTAPLSARGSSQSKTPATAPVFPPNFHVPPPAFAAAATMPQSSPIISAPPPPPQLPPTPTSHDHRGASSLKSPPMTPSATSWKPTTPLTAPAAVTLPRHSAPVRDTPTTPRTPLADQKLSIGHKAPERLDKAQTSQNQRHDSCSAIRVPQPPAPHMTARSSSVSEAKRPPPQKDTSSEYLDSLFNNKAPSTDFRKLPKIEKKASTSVTVVEKEKHQREKEKSAKKTKEHKQRRKEDGSLETKEERHKRKEHEREKKDKNKKERKKDRKHREERKRSKEDFRERKRSKSKKEDREKKSKKKKKTRHSDLDESGSSDSEAESYHKSLQKFSSLVDEGGISVGQSMYDRVKRRSSAVTKDEAKKNALQALREKNHEKKAMRKRVHLDSSDEDTSQKRESDESSEESAAENVAKASPAESSDEAAETVEVPPTPAPVNKPKKTKPKQYSSSESDSEVDSKKKKLDKKSSTFNMDDVFGADSSEDDSTKKHKKEASTEPSVDVQRKKKSELNFESIFGSDLPQKKKAKKNKEDSVENKQRKRPADEAEKSAKRKKHSSHASEPSSDSENERKQQQLSAKNSVVYSEGEEMKTEEVVSVVTEEVKPEILSDTSVVMQEEVATASVSAEVVVKEEPSDPKPTRVVTKGAMKVFDAPSASSVQPSCGVDSSDAVDSESDDEDANVASHQTARPPSSGSSSCPASELSDSDSHRTPPPRRVVELVDATAGYTSVLSSTSFREPTPEAPKAEEPKEPSPQPLPVKEVAAVVEDSEVATAVEPPSPAAPDHFVDEESEKAVLAIADDDQETEDAVLSIFNDLDEEQEPQYPSHDFIRAEEPPKSAEAASQDITEDQVMAESFVEEPLPDEEEEEKMETSRPSSPAAVAPASDAKPSSVPSSDAATSKQSDAVPPVVSQPSATRPAPTPAVVPEAVVVVAESPKETIKEPTPEKQPTEHAVTVVEEQKPLKQADPQPTEVFVPTPVVAVSSAALTPSPVCAPPVVPVTVTPAVPVPAVVQTSPAAAVKPPPQPAVPVEVKPLQQSSVIQTQPRGDSPAQPSAPSSFAVVSGPSASSQPPAVVTLGQHPVVATSGHGGSLTQGQPLAQPSMIQHQQYLMKLQQQQQQQARSASVETQQRQKAPPAATPSPVPKTMTPQLQQQQQQQQVLAAQQQMVQMQQMMMKDPALVYQYQQMLSQMPPQMAQQWLAMYAQQQLMTSSQQPITSQQQNQQMEMLRQQAALHQHKLQQQQQQLQQHQQPSVSQSHMGWRTDAAAVRQQQQQQIQQQQQQQMLMMRAVQQQQAQASPAMSHCSSASSVVAVSGNDRAQPAAVLPTQMSPAISQQQQQAVHTSHFLCPSTSSSSAPSAEDALESKTPTVWRGQVQMKTNEATVQLHLISGQRDFVSLCLGPLVQLNSEDKPKMRINQRMRTESQQLSNVLTKLQVCGAACLCVPIGVSKEDASRNNQNLKTHFLEYFTNKGAAGIASMPATETSPASLVYIFPPSEFTDTFMSQYSVQLYQRIKHNAGLGYLFVVVLPADDAAAP